jgi:transcriptional regulator with XRE-family HTH domain
MTPDPDQVVLDRIQSRIRQLGLSERRIAELSGLRTSTNKNMQQGESKSPRLDTIRTLASTLK